MKDKVEFSKRELEIIELVCKQDTSKEIASKLFIGERTIENHRQRIMRKMLVTSPVGLVIYALKHKLVNINQL